MQQEIEVEGGQVREERVGAIFDRMIKETLVNAVAICLLGERGLQAE